MENVPHMSHEDDLVVEAVLPAGMTSFEYAKNHHYVKFKRKDGRELKVVPSGQMYYRCSDKACDFNCYSDSNHGELACPKCRAGKLQGQWMRPQTVMVPQQESDFEWPSDVKVSTEYDDD